MIEGYDHMPVHVHWVTVQEIPLYRTQRLMPEQVAGLSCCGRKSSYFYCRYNRGCSGAGMKVKYLISRVQYFLAMISPKPKLTATATEPQPNRNRTATEPQPNRNRNRTATEPQPNRNRTATKPQPNRNPIQAPT